MTENPSLISSATFRRLHLLGYMAADGTLTESGTEARRQGLWATAGPGAPPYFAPEVRERLKTLEAASTCCPQCRSNKVEQTTLAIPLGPDTNRANCLECGWAGYSFELAPPTAPAASP